MKVRTQILMLKGALTKKVPLYVQFAVSNRCNMRCIMCNALDSRKNEKELDLSEIENLAKILKNINVAILILSGGEPLIRNDLADIIKIFTDKGIEVRIQTNGILASDEKVKQFVMSGLSEVTISLDSLDPEKHDSITGVPGSWQKIIKSIAIFLKYLPKKGNMSGINTVASMNNIEEIPKIIKFATSIGLYSSIIPLHACDNLEEDFIVRKISKEFKIGPAHFEIIDRIYKKITDMKKTGYNVHNSYRFLSESKDFLKYNQVKWHCDSPFLYFSISPSGFFLPCVDIPTSIPILDGNFVKKYYSKEFQDLIKEKVSKCRGCMYACYPEVSYFCRDFSVFLERIIQGVRISNRQRRDFDYESLIRIISQIKREN